ncbi:MAG: hypothetical protein MJZ25_08475 [Fibrobacter sp.]|nr:hypothetical protein [Fibrobacter sp.]
MDRIRYCGKALAFFTLFGGLFSATSHASIAGEAPSKNKAYVYTLLGQEIVQFSEKNMSYAEAIKLCSQKLSSGSYIVRISVAGINKIVPLHVNK